MIHELDSFQLPVSLIELSRQESWPSVHSSEHLNTLIQGAKPSNTVVVADTKVNHSSTVNRETSGTVIFEFERDTQDDDRMVVDEVEPSGHLV